MQHLSSLLDGARAAEPDPSLTSLTLGRTTSSDSTPKTVSGLPLRRLGNTFETWQAAANPGMGAAFAKCRAVGLGEATKALLSGRPGNGKTHLAIAAMNAYGLERSFFWKVPDFLDWFKRKVIEERHDPERLLRPYREHDFLLVLDDLGVEQQTEYSYQQLYRVLDSRADNRLPTIITSNQPPTKIDERIVSRYRSGLVACDGKDVRSRFDA